MKKPSVKTTGYFLLGAVVLALAAVLVYNSLMAEKVSEFMAMDTYNTLKISGIDSNKVTEEINNFVNDFDLNVISRHSDSSVVYSLNKNKGGKTDERLRKYLDILTDIYEASDGAFDFTLGALSDLWGFGTENERVPSEEEINAVLNNCGADKITFSGDEISFPDGVVLDMGASGKGIALDEIRENYLENSHTERAVISLGGSILLYGEGDFTVGIRNPHGENDNAAVLTVGECCVSTSGSYERYFEADGVRYHHILDPETGYPVDNGLVSVTIVSDSGTYSDILSTACFVLGKEKGMLLAEKYGCGYVFIDESGEMTVSDDLIEKISVENDSFVIAD